MAQHLNNNKNTPCRQKMKYRNSKILRLISITTFICFVNACTIMSVKESPINDTDIDQNLKILIVHTPDQVFELKNFKIVDGKISGRIDLKSEEIDNHFKVLQLQVYVSEIKGNVVQGEMIKISTKDINKISFFKDKTNRAILVIAGVILLGGIIMYASSLANAGFVPDSHQW